MGYHETPCALCGMRFESGRIRTAHELQQAAWNNSHQPPEDDGCVEEGCKRVARRAIRRDHRLAAGESLELEVTGSFEDRDDVTWDWLADVGEEHFHDVLPTGYDAWGDEVTIELFKGSGARDIGPRYYGANQSLARSYDRWFSSEVGKKNLVEKECAECKNDPLVYMYEHIGGPNCAVTNGYSGYNISLEEMRACNAVQCLVLKEGGFVRGAYEPQSDDEDFERESDYFLTGLGEMLGAVETDSPVYPIRHGADDAFPAEDGGFDEGNMPFHPYCLEAYKRVSRLRRGKVDIVGLAQWFDREASKIPMHPAVHRGCEQWWEHVSGDEFLVANPLYVPALPAIFESSRRLQPDFNVKSSPFSGREMQPREENDSFGKLPEELRHMVLASLGSKDIANLRLASSTFRHLPIWLWHDLMQREMPWMWEAWSDLPYSFWACTTKKELEDRDKAMNARQDVIGSSSDLSDEEKKRQKGLIASERVAFRQPRVVERLERTKTDWHFLYRQIKRDWSNLKGLQNRERIWTTLEYIVRRIDRPDEDREFAGAEHEKEHPFSEAYEEC